MAIQQVAARAAGVDAKGLPGVSALRALIALGTVWPAKLATSFDWGSPNVGTGIALAAAAYLIRLVAERLTLTRTLRFLAEPALARGIVVVLLGSGAWSVFSLAAHPQRRLPTVGVATVIGRLARSPSGGGPSVGPADARTGGTSMWLRPTQQKPYTRAGPSQIDTMSGLNNP